MTTERTQAGIGILVKNSNCKIARKKLFTAISFTNVFFSAMCFISVYWYQQ